MRQWYKKLRTRWRRLVGYKDPLNGFRELSSDEWNSSTDLWLMLKNAEEQAGNCRKMNLFALACCRAHWSALIPEDRAILEESEDAFDRPMSFDERHRANHSLRERANQAVKIAESMDPNDKLQIAAAKSLCYAIIEGRWCAYGYYTELDPSKTLLFVDFVRDIFGNPFDPVVIEPAWRTGRVVSLAKMMHCNRDFSAMHQLADALRDAGCQHHGILDHCFQATAHFRGCWLVDSILGFDVGRFPSLD